MKDFGDPDLLVHEENLVLLKLCKPWRTSHPLPKGCNLVDNHDSRTLRTTTDGLVCARKDLKKVGVIGALFAGCVAFGTKPAVAEAAVEVLASGSTLVLIHNRDNVCQLAVRFPCVRVLVLFHDLRVHLAKELAGGSKDATTLRMISEFFSGLGPGKHLSRLQRVTGDCPGMGCDHLVIDLNHQADLAKLCPEVREQRMSHLLSNLPYVTTRGTHIPDALREHVAKVFCPAF